jgi:hypothetical protein
MAKIAPAKQVKISGRWYKAAEGHREHSIEFLDGVQLIFISFI